MKEKMTKIMEAFHKYNSNNMAEYAFGFDETIEYDALVVAPAFTPHKLRMEEYCTVTTMRNGAYASGYLVENKDFKIAWIKTGASATNVMDYMSVASELKFKKAIFVAAAGGLKTNFPVGTICTPSYMISGYVNSYLNDSIKQITPFKRIEPTNEAFVDECIKLADKSNYMLKLCSAFNVDSLALEYLHLDEIKKYGTDLVDMHSSIFYEMIDLMEVPGIALLSVSDNLATGAPFLGRNAETQAEYNKGRIEILRHLVIEITKNVN
ncbi:MAG: hypothetical protein K6A63_05260 [Acholeplasmatales bacterium]|nr:hypothetical protein [Acholeplasmatales bacterium]